MTEHFMEESAAGQFSELRLHIPAALEEVAPARHQIADWTRAQSLPPDDVDAVMLAFGEACSNAIFYGGAGSAAPVVQICCRALSCGCLQIDVKNQGNGFDPDLETLCQLPDDGGFATHGRGFALMCALMDEVAVLCDDGDTVIRLTKFAAPGQISPIRK